MDLRLQDVALELHEKVICRGATVDVELPDLEARICLHGNGKVVYLIRERFERCTGDMRATGPTCEPIDGAARIGSQ